MKKFKELISIFFTWILVFSLVIPIWYFWFFKDNNLGFWITYVILLGILIWKGNQKEPHEE